jgi:hypothetical protein
MYGMSKAGYEADETNKAARLRRQGYEVGGAKTSA